MANKKLPDIKEIKKNAKCCIIGFAPSWKEAPFHDKDVDFWGINELYMYLQQYKIETPFAAWFEIHDIMNSPSKQGEQHQNFLIKCKIPLITQQHWSKYPSSRPYPRQAVKAFFNNNFITEGNHSGFSDYSNQISWMIALAIFLDYKEIMVYGVDMAQESEYAFQRASCQFFIGYAAGKGIKLKIPASCELLKAGADYGFQTDNTNRHRKKNKIKSLREQLQQIDIRNAQIIYAKDKIDKDLKEKMTLLKFNIKTLEDQIKNIEVETEKALKIQEIVSNIPDDPQERKKGQTNILNQCENTLKELKISKSKVSKELKDFLAKEDRMLTDNSVNHTLLDTEYDHNIKSFNKIEGMIKEAQHDLNNNLV